MSNPKPIIAISMGDPAGIGPETCLRAVSSPEVLDQCRPIIVGDQGLLRDMALRINAPFPEQILSEEEIRQDLPSSPAILDYPCDLDGIEPGTANAKAGRASVRYIEIAADLARKEQVAAMVTAPITKLAIKMAGIDFPGHTEMLASISETERFAMMLYSDRIAVSFVTTHQSLASVPASITKERILEVTDLMALYLARIRAKKPSLAMVGLNPHSGEAGIFGREEIEIIGPAVDEARRLGHDVAGPIPPDTAFLPEILERFDGHVCMYHDQGGIPFKHLSFHDGVNITMGLPFVRTSPDHGSAYGIAWKGEADPGSLIHAIDLAVRLSH